MDNCTTVLIADNSEEFCTSLSAALQRSEGFQILGTGQEHFRKHSNINFV